MKQFLLKIAGYGLVAFALLNGIAFLCLLMLGRSSFYKPQFIKNGVVENNFDYVVLGSSTGLTTLDTKLIDSVTRKKGLNISMDDSQLSSHYLMLLHFYALHKKTKCLVLAVTPWDMAETHPVLNDNDYRFLPDIDENNVYEYYKKMEQAKFKVLSLSKYFPICGVCYYNTELFYPSILAALQPKKRNRFDDKGNYSYPTLGGPTQAVYKTMSLETKNPFYKSIEAFCKANDIRLVLYQSPMYKTAVESTIENNFVNHSGLLKDSTLFYDNIHVNSMGRKICSEKFAAYLALQPE